MIPVISRVSMVLLCAAAAAQKPLWELPGNVPSTLQWYSIGSIGDWDGDGVQDLLTRFVDRASPGAGAISVTEIRSGQDARPMWQHVRFGVSSVQGAGDCDGDGRPDLLLFWGGGQGWIQVWSTYKDELIWEASADPSEWGYEWGNVILSDIDLNGDGLQDVIVCSSHAYQSMLYAWDSFGNLLYSRDLHAINRAAASACNMGDMNGDGCDDYVLGCEDASGRGMMTLTSGIDGTDMRSTFGLVAGDRLTSHATNLGDIDGDGVPDYMGCPSIWTQTGLTMQISGATGAPIRYWYDYVRSIVAGQDFDLDRDGVPDILVCNGYEVAYNTFGRSRAISGRDGTVLWQVDNPGYQPGGNFSYGSWGWGRYAASLGTWPGQVYPVLAWLDLDAFLSGNWPGRIRVFGSELFGQGPVTGEACATGPTLPMIGARNTQAGARVTVAKAPEGAFAVLNLSKLSHHKQVSTALPTSLSVFGSDGCELLSLPEASYWRITGTAGIDRGYAAVDLPFSLSHATVGTDLVAQWLVFHPESLQFVATELHHLRGQ